MTERKSRSRRRGKGRKQAATEPGASSSGRQHSGGKGEKQISITLPDGTKRRFAKGVSARTVLDGSGIVAPHPIVAARYRNKVTSLARSLDQSGPIAPIHLGTLDGALIARRSLTFVLVVAVQELFPKVKVYINHSLDHGYYAELYGDDYRKDAPISLAPSDIEAIERRMHEIVAADVPIERTVHPVEEAAEIFRKAGMEEKVRLLEYAKPKSASVYRLRGRVNTFYGQLVPSTGVLKVFELRQLEPGLILRFPPTSNPAELPPRQNIEKMTGVMREHERWAKILQWRTVAQLNELIASGREREYVLIAESLHEKRLAAIADTITNHPRQPRIVLLSGPSSSGKTTTTKRLAIHLRVNGKKPVIIELDNFFVDRDRTPRDEQGDYDFESFHAIDVVRLQQTVRELMSGRKTRIPKFDFKAGRGVDGEELQLDDDGILILEGIHGLNDQLLPGIPDGMKFKIYASPLTHLNVDDHNRISSADARLIRRIVRDNNYRGHDAMATIARWPSVRRGEERNIFPYQHGADAIFNSALPYETAVLKQFAVPVLKKVKADNPEYAEAARLIKFLSYFRDIDADFIPRHSLLREFVGGSCFTY